MLTYREMALQLRVGVVEVAGLPICQQSGGWEGAWLWGGVEAKGTWRWPAGDVDPGGLMGAGTGSQDALGSCCSVSEGGWKPPGGSLT